MHFNESSGMAPENHPLQWKESMVKQSVCDVIPALHMRYSVHRSSSPGVFNLSASAGHINNFNDARGPQSYTWCTCTHNWEKCPERQSDHKPLYNVQTTSGARVCSYFFKTARGPRQRAEDPWSSPTTEPSSGEEEGVCDVTGTCGDRISFGVCGLST
jgi:hypothetical protein